MAAIVGAAAWDGDEPYRFGLTAVAEFEIAAKGGRRPDIDNLLFGMKPFYDGLQDAGVIVDDRQIIEHRCRWLCRERRSERTRIRLYPNDMFGRGEFTRRQK